MTTSMYLFFVTVSELVRWLVLVTLRDGCYSQSSQVQVLRGPPWYAMPEAQQLRVVQSASCSWEIR